LTAIQELPGVVADTILTSEVESKLLYYKAWRCFFTATAYSKLSRHVEAIALFDRAQSYATQIRSGLGRSSSHGAGNDTDSFKVTEKELQEIESKIRGRKCQVHAAWYLENGQEGGDGIEDKLSSMSLDEKSLDEVRLPLECFLCHKVYGYEEGGEAEGEVETEKERLSTFRKENPDFV
jgi:signal recognition particle subunit SRP68